MNPETQLHLDIQSGLEKFAKMPLEERLKMLQEIGILNEDLKLAERYGGQPSKAELAMQEAEQSVGEAR